MAIIPCVFAAGDRKHDEQIDIATVVGCPARLRAEQDDPGRRESLDQSLGCLIVNLLSDHSKTSREQRTSHPLDASYPILHEHPHARAWADYIGRSGVFQREAPNL